MNKNSVFTKKSFQEITTNDGILVDEVDLWWIS